MLPCVSRSPETFSQSITATCSVTLRGAAGKIILLPVHSCPCLPFEQNAFAFDAQRQSDSSPSFLTTRRHEIVSESEVAVQASVTSLAELDDPTRFAMEGVA